MLTILPKQRQVIKLCLGLHGVGRRGGTVRIVAYQEFDLYGNPVNNAAGGDPYGYTVEWYEGYINLLHLRARWYAPEIGRFISKDPLSGFVDKPQSLNRWAYVQNNPAVRTDPTGLLDQTCKNCGPKIDDWFLEEIASFQLEALGRLWYTWLYGNAHPAHQNLYTPTSTGEFDPPSKSA